MKEEIEFKSINVKIKYKCKKCIGHTLNKSFSLKIFYLFCRNKIFLFILDFLSLFFHEIT